MSFSTWDSSSPKSISSKSSSASIDSAHLLHYKGTAIQSCWLECTETPISCSYLYSRHAHQNYENPELIDQHVLTYTQRNFSLEYKIWDSSSKEVKEKKPTIQSFLFLSKCFQNMKTWQEKLWARKKMMSVSPDRERTHHNCFLDSYIWICTKHIKFCVCLFMIGL